MEAGHILFYDFFCSMNAKYLLMRSDNDTFTSTPALPGRLTLKAIMRSLPPMQGSGLKLDVIPTTT